MTKDSKTIGGINIVGGLKRNKSKKDELSNANISVGKLDGKVRDNPRTDEKAPVKTNKVPSDSSGVEIGKKPSFKERIKAKSVKKENVNIEKAKEKQVQQFRKGKVDTKELHFDERSIWNKILSDRLYSQFKEMGDTEEAISGFQKKRMAVSFGLLLTGLIMGLLLHPFIIGIGLVMAIVSYYMKGRSVDAFYNNWKFERQLAFSKFTRLVIPYLKSSDGNMALYTIFNRIIRRMDDPEDKRNLYQLMSEMGDDPANIKPFIDFAERSSGTDMSHLFMTTIFDFQQTTFDVGVIDELGKLASEDMMNSVDEIIDFKLRRFAMFPTKIVMSSFLLVLGLAIGMMVHELKGLNFGNDDAIIEDPAQEESVDEEDVSARLSTDDELIFGYDKKEWL